MEIYWSTENKSSLLKFSKEMEQEISEYRKQFTQEDTMAGMIQGWLDAYKGSHVCSVQIWKEAFDHFDREPKKFETNELNVFDVLKYDTVVVTKAAVATIEEVYA